jgi:hypothetical protein
VNAALRQPFTKTRGVVWKHGGACHHHGPWTKGSGRAVVTEEHGLGLVGVHDKRDEYVTSRTERGGIGTGYATLVLKLAQRLRAHIAGVCAKACEQERARDPHSHRA